MSTNKVRESKLIRAHAKDLEVIKSTLSVIDINDIVQFKFATSVQFKFAKQL